MVNWINCIKINHSHSTNTELVCVGGSFWLHWVLQVTFQNQSGVTRSERHLVEFSLWTLVFKVVSFSEGSEWPSPISLLGSEIVFSFLEIRHLWWLSEIFPARLQTKKLEMTSSTKASCDPTSFGQHGGHRLQRGQCLCRRNLVIS